MSSNGIQTSVRFSFILSSSYYLKNVRHYQGDLGVMHPFEF